MRNDCGGVGQVVLEMVAQEARTGTDCIP